MRLPVSAFFFVGELLVGRDESSALSRIGKIWAVRCHYVDQKKKTIGHFGEQFLPVFEAGDCTIPDVEVVG
jgi:hypothetical protein